METEKTVRDIKTRKKQFALYAYLLHHPIHLWDSKTHNASKLHSSVKKEQCPGITKVVGLVLVAALNFFFFAGQNLLTHCKVHSIYFKSKVSVKKGLTFHHHPLLQGSRPSLHHTFL